MNAEQQNRLGDAVYRCLLAAVSDYRKARLTSLIECYASDEPRWDRHYDLTDATHRLETMVARYVAWGDGIDRFRADVTEEARRHPEIYARSFAYLVRVCDDLYARMAGSAGAIPSSDGLPPVPTMSTGEGGG